MTANIKIRMNSLSNRLYEEVELDSERGLQPILDWVDEYKKENPKDGFQNLNFKFLKESNIYRNGAVVSSIPPCGCRPYKEVWEDEIELGAKPTPLKNGWFKIVNSRLHFFLCKKENIVLFITF